MTIILSAGWHDHFPYTHLFVSVRMGINSLRVSKEDLCFIHPSSVLSLWGNVSIKGYNRTSELGQQMAQDDSNDTVL